MSVLPVAWLERLLVVALVVGAFVLWGWRTAHETLPPWALVAIPLVAVALAALWGAWIGPALRWSRMGAALGFKTLARPGQSTRPLAWPSFEGKVRGRNVWLSVRPDAHAAEPPAATGRARAMTQTITVQMREPVEFQLATRGGRRRLRQSAGVVGEVHGIAWRTVSPQASARVAQALASGGRWPLWARVWTSHDASGPVLLHVNRWEKLNEARARRIIIRMVAVADALEATAATRGT